MKVFTSLLVAFLVVTIVSAAVEPPKGSSEFSNSNPTLSSSNNNNNNSNNNNERKLRFEADKKEVSSFLNTKNILRTVVKLVFGSNEESTATSRQVLNVLVKVLDLLRNSFGQKARSTTGRGIRDMADDVALAGVTMVQGHLKSILAKDPICVQKYICESSKATVREGRELGYLVAQVGGYASSSLLENSKASPFNDSFEAARRGRSGEDCVKLYSLCNEAD